MVNHYRLLIVVMFLGICLPSAKNYASLNDPVKQKNEESSLTLEQKALLFISGIAASFIIYKGISWLSTETNSLLEAENNIQMLDNNLQLIIQETENNHPELLRRIRAYYANNYTPLTQAFDDLSVLLRRSRNIVSLLNRAVNDPEASQRAHQHLRNFNAAYFNRISNALVALRSDVNFNGEINYKQSERLINIKENQITATRDLTQQLIHLNNKQVVAIEKLNDTMKESTKLLTLSKVNNVAQ